MAQSYVQYRGNGSTVTFAVPFPYINKTHVSVKVNGVPAGFLWSGDSTINLTHVVPGDGAVVEVRRTTPNASRLVDFVDGSVLTESDLDQNSTQFLYLSQEAQDRADEAPRLTAQNTYDFQGRRATNLADPVDAQDAVTKTWAEAAQTSTLAQAQAARDDARNAVTDAKAQVTLAAGKVTEAGAQAAAAKGSADAAEASAVRAEAASNNPGTPSGGGGNPIYDRKALGGHGRTFTDIASDAVSIFEFVTPAMLAGTLDAGPALNAAANYCRSASIRTLHVPAFPGSILINTTVDLTLVHLSGPGTGHVTEAAFRTTADITTFTSSQQSAITGIRLDHEGNGRLISFPGALNYTIADNALVATKANATAGMVSVGGSNYFIDRNAFTNLRTGGYSIESIRGTDDLCINNSIRGNYFGGSGKGIVIGSAGAYTNSTNPSYPNGKAHVRQEGLEISDNHSILYGGAFIEVQSILNLRILNNMIDQGHSLGCILFTPQGATEENAITGVTIIGNYISPAQDAANAIAIRHFTAGGGGVAQVSIIGNEICYCGTGCYFGESASGIVLSANLFHTLASQTCVRVTSDAVAARVTFARDNTSDGFSLIVDGRSRGQFRSTSAIASATNDGNWTGNSFSGVSRYINVPHNLGCAPDINHVTVQCREVGGNVTQAISATILAVDAASVQVHVAVFGLAATATVVTTVKAAVSGSNA